MRYRKRRSLAEINVVPYIDVMLVLLIIFMITTPILSQGVNVELPSAPSAPLDPDTQEPIVVNVDKEGLLYINYGENSDQPVAAAELIERVKTVRKYQPENPIYVGGDTHAAYGNVMRAMVLLQQAGVDNIGMLTDAETAVETEADTKAGNQ